MPPEENRGVVGGGLNEQLGDSITTNIIPGNQDQPQQNEVDMAESNRDSRGGLSSAYGTMNNRDDTTDAQPIPRTPGEQPRPTRQPMSRRASSTIVGPRRGQNFSVDDDAQEYETEAQQRRTAQRSASNFGQTLKRQNSILRRRGQTVHGQSLGLPRVDSTEEDDEAHRPPPKSAPYFQSTHPINIADELPADNDAPEDAEDDGSASEAESFTLKDRQQAINQTHPFGIRIWKPALYKKNRSVEKSAEGDIHSSPGGRVSNWLFLFNILWTVLFGWWLALFVGFSALVCLALGFVSDAGAYGKLLIRLAIYLFYPFGKFVKLEQVEEYAEEDEGEGRSITEYEQWQNGDIEDGRLFFGPPNSASIVGRRRAASMESADENDSLLGHSRARGPHEDDDANGKSSRKRRLFGRGQWTAGRVLFFAFFYGLIGPLLLLVSGICWFLVFWIPMGRVTAILSYHLRRHPLALSFHSDTSYSRGPGEAPSAILVCTYRAVGLKYWKYTVDGTNIFLLNFMVLVLFTIFDYFVLEEHLHLQSWITHPGLIFILGLISIIPLAYFIGQAVASISAQSSMGVGAVINAFFATVVEVFLYCVALNDGRSQLVEGSLIGSLFVGILFLPGISMVFGAVKRKTQRFNIKSAGVTSTMLLFSTIAAFGPTLFYQIYGSHELNCTSCTYPGAGEDCQRCYFSQVPAVNDRFFNDAVRPYTWFAAVLLFVSYLVGLWFTLRTHAAVIWNDTDEKKPTPHQSVPVVVQSVAKKTSSRDLTPTNPGTAVKDSQLYKRILGQSLKQIGLETNQNDETRNFTGASGTSSLENSAYLSPQKDKKDATNFIDTLSTEQNERLARHVAEVAATAAVVATRDAFKSPKLVHTNSTASAVPHVKTAVPSAPGTVVGADPHGEHDDHAGGGHDAPNWGRMKSTIILLVATLLYAVIAEILVNTVHVVLENFDIDEKFLGITLFAIVPNTTEFLNAIAFAMNGNIALSMEIGSAYALQVCLLQIPALVLYSAWTAGWWAPEELFNYTFSLIFPQWDMVTVILCVFLFSYIYGEGKSNYFKGSILCLAYFVIVIGFYLSSFSNHMDASGVNRFEIVDTSKTYKTIGRSTRGQAF